MKRGEDIPAGSFSSICKTAMKAATQSLKGVGAKMDFFQHRYYHINKIFLMIIGRWPYQPISVRRSILAVLILLSTSQTVPQLLAPVKHHNNLEFLLECISPLIFHGGCVVKFFCYVWNSQKILKLLNCIRDDWELWAHDREVNFLHEYAERGRKLTILYAVIPYSACILFNTQPMIAKIIDIWLKNDSKPGEFPIPLDYYVLDMEKYYFHIMTYYLLCVFVSLLVYVSGDAMFMVYVQHCCGIFAALGYKIERFGKNERSSDFEHLLLCINRHKRAIKLAELIEATYTWYFFFILGFNMILISITGFQIFMNSTDPHGVIRYIAFNIVVTVHLYCESYMCQILMDHSISVRDCLLNVKWYKLPLNVQKLLPLMIMRCNKPCILTAGKICIMSIKSFGAILKTSVSYFTILRSV